MYFTVPLFAFTFGILIGVRLLYLLFGAWSRAGFADACGRECRCVTDCRHLVFMSTVYSNILYYSSEDVRSVYGNILWMLVVSGVKQATSVELTHLVCEKAGV